MTDDASGVTFSIIVPAHGDRQALLNQALETVLGQTRADWECIVVDDASPVPLVVPTDPRFRVVRLSTNGGPARARNAGVAISRGRILTFLDSDDGYAPDRLDIAFESVREAPIGLARGSRTPLNGRVHDRVLDETTPHLNEVAIRRDAWIPLDETYRSCEDLEWWLRVTVDNAVASVAKDGHWVRRHSGPRVGYGNAQRLADSARLMRDHHDYFENHPRARAFRFTRMAYLSTTRKKRLAFAKASLRAHPTRRALKALVLAILPARKR